MYNLVLDYNNYVAGLKDLIKNSPYKTSYILEKLNMPKATYYKKVRENSFKIDEVNAITELLFPNEVVEHRLKNAMKQVENNEVVNSVDARQQLKSKYAI